MLGVDESGVITDLSRLNPDTALRRGASWLVRAEHQVWDRPRQAGRSESEGGRPSGD